MSPKYVALFRGFTTLLAAAAAVHVATLLFDLPSFRSTLPDQVRLLFTIAYLLVTGTAAIACLLSLALTWRAAGQADARALALFLAFLAVFWAPLFRFFSITVDADAINFGVTFGSTMLSRLSIAAFVLSVAAFVRFSAVFPRPLTAGDIRSSRFLRPIRAIRLKLLNPAVPWGIAIGLAIPFLRPAGGQGAPVGELGPAWIAEMVMMGLLYVGVPLLGMAGGALNLRSGYAASGGAERRRVLWVVAGCVVGTWMIVGAVALSFWGSSDSSALDLTIMIPILLLLAPLVVVLCLTVAVFYKGAVHPALVINRATVYSGLGLLLVGLFSAMESLVSEMLEGALGLSNTASAALLGALITILLIPLRGPLSRWLARWLPSAEGGDLTRDEVTG